MQFAEIIKDSKPSAQRANSLEIKGNWSRELVRKIIENEEIDIVLTNDRARLNSSNARSDGSYFIANAKCQFCSKSGTKCTYAFSIKAVPLNIAPFTVQIEVKRKG